VSPDRLSATRGHGLASLSRRAAVFSRQRAHCSAYSRSVGVSRSRIGSGQSPSCGPIDSGLYGPVGGALVASRASWPLRTQESASILISRPANKLVVGGFPVQTDMVQARRMHARKAFGVRSVRAMRLLASGALLLPAHLHAQTPQVEPAPPWLSSGIGAGTYRSTAEHGI
jgi:hypothetical protein